MITHFFSQEQRRSEFSRKIKVYRKNLSLNVKETKMWHSFEELKKFQKKESILPLRLNIALGTYQVLVPYAHFFFSYMFNHSTWYYTVLCLLDHNIVNAGVLFFELALSNKAQEK